jgi:hypothetical protein
VFWMEFFSSVLVRIPDYTRPLTAIASRTFNTLTSSFRIPWLHV